MNNYITLDSYKYPVLAADWESHPVRPASAEPMLNGDTAVTFGPASHREWNGSIKAEVTARDTGWGTIVTLRATLVKLSTLSYTDVYGSAYTVLCSIAGPEASLSQMWDAADNDFSVKVNLREV